jgi:allantoinase
MTLPRGPPRLLVDVHPPSLALPGNGRMIVWTVVNVEEWEITRPMARQLSRPADCPRRSDNGMISPRV